MHTDRPGGTSDAVQSVIWTKNLDISFPHFVIISYLTLLRKLDTSCAFRESENVHKTSLCVSFMVFMFVSKIL